MDERRYDEAEIATIFAKATERAAIQPRKDAKEGLTLAELQQIGREVGVPADEVARAAARLDQPTAVLGRQPAAVSRKFLKQPMEVARTVDVTHRLTESDWEQLVADLRTTFEARGSVSVQARRREWRGGGVKAILEQGESVERFHIRALNRTGPVLMMAGLAGLNVAAITFYFPLVGLDFTGSFLRISVLALIAGSGVLLWGVRRLKSWARMARHQIDGVVGRLLSSTGRADG